MKYDAIVIGAGPNGLVAAGTLAKAGRRVLLLESGEDAGGHARTVEFAPGFRAPLSEDCGWIPPQVGKLLGLSAIATVERRRSISTLMPGGELFSLPADVAAATAALRTFSTRDASRWPAFVARLHEFSAILGALFQVPPPDIDTTSLREILPLLRIGRRLRALGRDDMIEFLRIMPMSIQDLLDDIFESEPLKAAIAACAVRDLRQGPRSGGTVYNLLHYMVGADAGSVRARRRWRDGPDAFTRAATEANRTLGVTLRTSAPVRGILVRDERAAGVQLESGEEVAAPIVVSTADPKRTLLGMVDPAMLDPELLLAAQNIRMRGCTAFVLFAFDAPVSDASPFGAPVSLTPTTSALEKAADAVKYGEIAAAPHVEFFVPTLRWPQLAPNGKHVLVARVHYAPFAPRQGEWDDDRSCAVMEAATAAIARVLPGFGDGILHRIILTPRDVEERFGVTEGALTHGELMLDQILFMRPVAGLSRYATPIPGLYLGGAGSHPGPGVLGGAGHLAARAALAQR